MGGDKRDGWGGLMDSEPAIGTEPPTDSDPPMDSDRPTDSTRSWQDQALQQISAAAAADRTVGECWVYGSAASGELDEWSDLDVALVVGSDDVLRIASPSWLSRLGQVWAYQTFGRDRGAGVRVVFSDGRLVDLAAVTDAAALSPDRRQVSLRTDGPDASLGSERIGASEVPDLPSLVHEFRFTAALAIIKDARDDLLIGTHLAMELPRLCLVVAMLLRDRDTGRTHHPFGGPWNAVADRVFDLVPDEDSGHDAVISLVDASAGLFDDLAGRLWPTYVSDWSGLTVLLDRARAHSRGAVS